MTDTPRGPTTEQLRARALAPQVAAYPVCRCGHRYDHHTDPGDPRPIGCWRCACDRYEPRLEASDLRDVPAALLLPRPCLACNREQGERMCDLCQRLEEAEARA